ncbi:MAG: Gfa-like protein [Parcubacteria group bacterium]|nr:Gfa-like protein [Parcubacteria group bacterium]
MKTYTGGCHCGKFRYEVDTDLEKVIECNCSHCHMKGLVLSFISPEQFRLTKGEEAEATEYLFNKKKIHHLFCPVCGVQSFAWGTNSEGNVMRCVNVRCLDDVDLKTLTITAVNGKDY